MKIVIKNAFADAYTVARFNAKKDFKKNAKKGNKWNVARALVMLNDVAQNPDKYFSPENTYDAWKQRALDCVKNHPEDVKKCGEQYVYNVAFGAIVQQPHNIVFDKIYPVIHDYFGYDDADYMDFCGAVQNYYYRNVFSGIMMPYEPTIFDFAEKMSKRANIVKQTPVKRAVMHWLAGNKRQY